MHISEGVLSAPILIGGAVLAAAGVGIGLSRIQARETPKVAVMGGAFFVASLIHVPIGPANLHLVLIGLTGILLGWAALPAVVIALFLQAVLFGFGGLTTLGVNTCIMGLPAVTANGLFRLMTPNGRRTAQMAAGFAAGTIAIFIAVALLFFALTTTGESLAVLAKAVFYAHLPLGVLEGLITMFAVGFFAKVKPDLLPHRVQYRGS